MNEIKITSSWTDKEIFIKCKKEDAWHKMLELATNEIESTSIEESTNIDVLFNYQDLEIILHYHNNDEYCYYRYISNIESEE